MTQGKHTPGPWFVGEVRHKYDCVIRNRDNDPVCLTVYAGYSEPTAEANARLIAAACNSFDAAAKKLGIDAVEFAERMQDGGLADLVEALEEFLGTYHNSGTPDEVHEKFAPRQMAFVRKVRAALAKARGE